jgi:hypothetical protein
MRVPSLLEPLDDDHPLIPFRKGVSMYPQAIFLTHLVLGYVVSLLICGTYILPRLSSMDRFSAQRIIATIHSFRFVGLVFILPGVVGPSLPAGFATFAAYGDFATAVLAILALLTTRMRPLFWSFVVVLNIAGTVDILTAYYHAIRLGLPYVAGQLGAAYVLPIIYVPMLMITHAIALYWLVRPQSNLVPKRQGNDAAYSSPRTGL